MPGPYPSTGDAIVDKIEKNLPSWSLHSTRRKQMKNKYDIMLDIYSTMKKHSGREVIT